MVWENHPNWRSPSFFRGVENNTNQISRGKLPYIRHGRAGIPAEGFVVHRAWRAPGTVTGGLLPGCGNCGKPHFYTFLIYNTYNRYIIYKCWIFHSYDSFTLHWMPPTWTLLEGSHVVEPFWWRKRTHIPKVGVWSWGPGDALRYQTCSILMCLKYGCIWEWCFHPPGSLIEIRKSYDNINKPWNLMVFALFSDKPIV